VGGVERVVWELSRHQAALGHQVSVICPADPPHAGPAVETVEGVKVHRLPYAFKLANTNITPSLPWHLLREPFDVIHTHLPTPWSADWSVLVGAIKHRKTLVTYYNDIRGAGVFDHVARLYGFTGLRLTLQLADAIIVNSSSILNSNDTPLRHVRKKVTLMPLGVDTDRFTPNNGSRSGDTIGFLSVLDEYHSYKGLPVLLEALSLVRNNRSQVRLLVAGSGAMKHRYQRLAAELHPEIDVEFLGYIPDADLSSFYNRCSVFALPSTDATREGFGLVVLEALACAVPVVVSRAAGIAHFLDEYQLGEVVPPGDVAALAASLLKQLEAGSISEKTRASIVEHFGWPAIARQSLALSGIQG
jgi:glycosyltransferase involved in cell wall biosynthesis